METERSLVPRALGHRGAGRIQRNARPHRGHVYRLLGGSCSVAPTFFPPEVELL